MERHSHWRFRWCLAGKTPKRLMCGLGVSFLGVFYIILNCGIFGLNAQRGYIVAVIETHSDLLKMHTHHNVDFFLN